jgi:hypothetical protein
MVNTSLWALYFARFVVCRFIGLTGVLGIRIAVARNSADRRLLAGPDSCSHSLLASVLSSLTRPGRTLRQSEFLALTRAFYLRTRRGAIIQLMIVMITELARAFSVRMAHTGPPSTPRVSRNIRTLYSHICWSPRSAGMEAPSG